MKCRPIDAIVFIMLSIIYGSAFAGVAQGMKYFQPCIMIAYRMLFGFGTCVIIFVIRLSVSKNYRPVALSHYTSGPWPIIHMMLSGLMFHAICQCMCAIALNWVQSAAAQIVQPLSSGTSAVMAHFVMSDERFTWTKFVSLICALIGVVLTSIPPFMRAEGGHGTKDLVVGYVLLVVAMIIQGIGMVWMRWKTPNSDITVSTMTQVGISAGAAFLWVLIWDSPKTLSRESLDAPPIAWLWPSHIGLLATGLAGHGFVFLVGSLGSVGGSFVAFGQILVGIIVSVSFMHEWRGYKVWEVLISGAGLMALAAAIFIGLILDQLRKVGQKDAAFEQERTSEGSGAVDKNGEVVVSEEIAEL